VIIVIFESLFPQGSAATQIRCGEYCRKCSHMFFLGHGVYLVTTLLQIFLRMCRWKKFKNRSIFHDNVDKSLQLTIWGTPCRNNAKHCYHSLCWIFRQLATSSESNV